MVLYLSNIANAYWKVLHDVPKNGHLIIRVPCDLLAGVFREGQICLSVRVNFSYNGHSSKLGANNVQRAKLQFGGFHTLSFQFILKNWRAGVYSVGWRLITSLTKSISIFSSVAIDSGDLAAQNNSRIFCLLALVIFNSSLITGTIIHEPLPVSSILGKTLAYVAFLLLFFCNSASARDGEYSPRPSPFVRQVPLYSVPSWSQGISQKCC